MREKIISDISFFLAAIQAVLVTFSLVALALFAVGWGIGVNRVKVLKDFMSYSSDIMVSLLIIFGAALALAFLLMFVCWLFKDEGGIIILPFEVAASEEKYSGKALSHLLTNELLRIRRIHETDYEGVTPIESEDVNVPVVKPSSEDVTTEIAKVGSVEAGTTSIPLGQILVSLKKLSPWGTNSRVISGCLQRYGSSTSLIACLELQNMKAWEARNTKKRKMVGDEIIPVGDEIIPDLVKDLSFMIIHDLSRGGSTKEGIEEVSADKKISAKTWQGFKYFSEALDAYHQYILTDSLDHLKQAEIECAKAVDSEINYELPIKLIINLGIAYTDKKGFSEAEALLIKAYEINQENFYVLFGLAYLYSAQKKYERAIKYFNLSIKIDPNDMRAWNGKGNALRRLGRYDEALACYIEALALDEEYLQAWNGKGNALLGLDRKEEALACYDKAINIDGRYVHAWNGKGNALSGLGRREEALACYDKAINIDRRYVHAWNGKGRALLELERQEEALKCFEEAINIDPKYVHAWNGKGVALVFLGRHDEALKCFDEAIDIAQKNMVSWLVKGYALEELDRHKEALICYEKILKFKPPTKNPTAHICVARLYRKFDRAAESNDACNTARELAEKSTEYKRAIFEAVCGNPAAALAQLKIALRKGEETAIFARWDPNFEFIRDDPRFKALLDEFSEDEKKGPE